MLNNRLLNMRISHGTTMCAYVNEICTIERTLAYAGNIIDEDDKKCASVNGLRQEYQIRKTILPEPNKASFEKI